MSPQNPFDINPEENQATNINAVAEEPVNQNEEDIFSDTEDDAEESNDIVWIIQKTIWSIVKFLLFAGIIGGSIWFIWGGKSLSDFNISLPSFSWFSSSDEAPKTPSKTIKNIEFETRNTEIKEVEIVSPSKAKTTQSVEKNPSALLVRWSLWMHRTQKAVAQNEIEKTMKWELEIQNYLGNDILAHLEAPTIYERTRKVEKFEHRMKSFVSRGKNLRNLLTVQHKTAANKLNQSQAKLTNITDELDSKLASKNYFGFESLLKQKYTTAGEVEKFKTQTNIRTYLLADIEKYLQYLSDIQYKLDTNRDAILSDVRVKAFSNDPFKRLQE